MSDKPESNTPSDAPTCRVEVEIQEDRRRYVTIEVSQEEVDRICEWLLKYNPTASERKAAIDAVKGAKVIKEEIIQDTYEIFIVDFPSDSQ